MKTIRRRGAATVLALALVATGCGYKLAGSNTFLPPSVLGFKFATFGFADAGYIAAAAAALFKEPLYASLGAGARTTTRRHLFSLRMLTTRAPSTGYW